MNKIKARILELEMPSLKSSIENITLKFGIDRKVNEKLFQKLCNAFRDNKKITIHIG